MSRRRWIADEFDEHRAWLLGANAAHLARVLRARAGQQFDLVCGPRLRAGTIAAVGDERVEFTLGEELTGEPERELILVAAIYKFDRMEWAIEKSTELGVTRIVPIIARRTDTHLAAAAGKRVERWRRLAHEAAQQSRRLAVPQIDPPAKLRAALGIEADTRLLLNENEECETMAEAMRGARGTLALAVGPEGGWTEEELQEFASAGWRSVSMGPTILRAETAAVAAMAVAAALLA